MIYLQSLKCMVLNKIFPRATAAILTQHQTCFKLPHYFSTDVYLCFPGYVSCSKVNYLCRLSFSRTYSPIPVKLNLWGLGFSDSCETDSVSFNHPSIHTLILMLSRTYCLSQISNIHSFIHSVYMWWETTVCLAWSAKVSNCYCSVWTHSGHTGQQVL